MPPYTFFFKKNIAEEKKANILIFLKCHLAHLCRTLWNTLDLLCVMFLLDAIFNDTLMPTIYILAEFCSKDS